MLFTLELLFFNIDTVITFLVVPQAVPKAFFESTKTYGMFYLLLFVPSTRKEWVNARLSQED